MITDMKAFVIAVREMRAFQKAYFAAAFGTEMKRGALHQSKAAEKRVDQMLAGEIAGQTALFTAGEGKP